MNKLILFFLAAFLILFSVPLRSQSHTDDDQTQSESTGGLYPAENQGEDTNEIPPNRGAYGNFPKIDAPQKTNDLHLAAQTQNETKPHYYVLEGYVDMLYQGIRLQADHAEYDAATKDLVATGNVVLDQEGQHLAGDRLELNLDTKKGVMYNARGFFPPQIFFWGPKLEKLDEDTYRLHDGVFTECSQIVPHWRLNTTTAKMTVNEYIHFKNFLLKTKNIPFFYSPYMMWPIRRDRATGFLFPSFGPNNHKGFWLGGSFFWAMTQSMDSTFWVDHYALRGWGGGSEYRYAASDQSSGSIKGYLMDDKLLGREWTASGEIKQELPADFRLAAIVDYFSSFEYIRDYSNSLHGALRQTKTAQAFLTRNWSYYSLNFLNNWQERQSSGSSKGSSFYHIPEIEFQSRSQQLGPTPFFGALLTSTDLLGQTTSHSNGTSSSFLYHRYDLFPSISWPITYLSWLTLTPSYGQRITYYSKQADQKNTAVDEPLVRNYKEIALDLRGPNFSKVFNTLGSGYSQKWKHAIEPQITFFYRQDIPEHDRILALDDVDFPLGNKAVTYSLTNLLYAKRPVKEQKEYKPDEYQYYNPKPLEEPPESPWEFISWKISQSYRLDSDSFNAKGLPDVQRLSPITSLVRVNPSVNYNIDFTTIYDIHFHQLTQLRLGATLRDVDKWYTNVSYVYGNPTPFSSQPGRPRATSHPSNSLQTNAGIGLWKNRLVLSGEANYNFTDKDLLSASGGITYNDDCFSVGVQFRHFSNTIRFGGKENQFTFSISLPNIGNLVNFQSGAPPRRY